MRSVSVNITSNHHLGDAYYLLKFREPNIAKNANPGQFLQIRVDETIKPLLRRPFSIFDVVGDKISVLYKVVGEGTRILSAKKVNERIGVMGPLGNGFNISDQFDEVFLIAGGIGIAPFKFLATKLSENNIDTTLFYGVRTKAELVAADYFGEFDVHISTDDGSSCFAGCVTDLFKQYLDAKEHTKAIIFACGPNVMMEAVAAIGEDYGIPCQLSLEEKMACGIGSCLGCAVQTKSGYQRVCVEGPVFDARDLLFA